MAAIVLPGPCGCALQKRKTKPVVYIRDALWLLQTLFEIWRARAFACSRPTSIGPARLRVASFSSPRRRGIPSKEAKKKTGTPPRPSTFQSPPSLSASARPLPRAPFVISPRGLPLWHSAALSLSSDTAAYNVAHLAAGLRCLGASGARLL